MISVELFFRLLNLLILIILFSYIFKQYIYPGIKQEIIHYFGSLKNLKQSIFLARQKQADLDNEYVQQRQEAQRLLENVKKWNSFVVHKREKMDYEIALRLKAIKHLRDHQEARYAESLLQKTLIPAAFKEATLVLQHEYRQDKKKAERVIDEIIRVLQNS